jgi:hypothetical protein
LGSRSGDHRACPRADTAVGSGSIAPSPRGIRCGAGVVSTSAGGAQASIPAGSSSIGGA